MKTITKILCVIILLYNGRQLTAYETDPQTTRRKKKLRSFFISFTGLLVVRIRPTYETRKTKLNRITVRIAIITNGIQSTAVIDGNSAFRRSNGNVFPRHQKREKRRKKFVEFDVVRGSPLWRVIVRGIGKPLTLNAKQHVHFRDRVLPEKCRRRVRRESLSRPVSVIFDIIFFSRRFTLLKDISNFKTVIINYSCATLFTRRTRLHFSSRYRSCTGYPTR